MYADNEIIQNFHKYGKILQRSVKEAISEMVTEFAEIAKNQRQMLANETKDQGVANMCGLQSGAAARVAAVSAWVEMVWGKSSHLNGKAEKTEQSRRSETKLAGWISAIAKK